MLIDKMLFPVTVLGPGKRLVVWTAGCHRRCPSCSNPELWHFDPSKERDFAADLTLFDISQIEGVTFTGGDPFDQSEALSHAVDVVREKGISDILVFSGYTYAELTARDGASAAVLGKISALVDGAFDQTKYTDSPLRGSSNQNLIVMDPTVKDKYDAYLDEPKSVEIVESEHEVHVIGIPAANYRKVYRDFFLSIGKDVKFY